MTRSGRLIREAASEIERLQAQLNVAVEENIRLKAKYPD